jgi:hypothetical protein
MVQRWQKDAEGIIIFVRQRSLPRICPYVLIGWLIERLFLCCRRYTCRRIRPRPQAHLAGHFRVLSQEHL